MAESPPPLDEVDIEQEEEEEVAKAPEPEPEEEEPLFADMEKPEETVPEPKPKEVDPEPDPEPAAFSAPTLEATAAEESPVPVVKAKVEEPKTLDLFGEDEDKMEAEVSEVVRHSI